MDTAKSPEITVVIPAYNEETRLNATLPHLWKALSNRFRDFEIIVVDDGSTDATADVVEMFSEKHAETRLIRYDKNYGKGYAVRTGVLAAKGGYILFSDADMSTPIREVRKLIRALKSGFDIAIGSRAQEKSKILEYQPLYRMFMGKIFNRIVRILTVDGFNDTQCGFKCFKYDVAQEIFKGCRIDGFGFDVEVLFVAKRKGFKIKEIGVIWRNSAMSKVHPIFHSLQMLKEIFAIRMYGFLGYYDQDDILRTRIES